MLNIAPYSHRPGRPHIDGYAPGQQTPGTFTLLAGLLLSDQTTNLWVWPGTHLAHAGNFGASGPEGFAAAGGYPTSSFPNRPKCADGGETSCSPTTSLATTLAATTRATAPDAPSTGVFGLRATKPGGTSALWAIHLVLNRPAKGTRRTCFERLIGLDV